MKDQITADPLPLSLLNDFLFCPRRAALKAIEGWREANEHTIAGDLVHEHADLPGYEIAKGVKLLRGLPVWSDRLRLSGKCDIVEVHPSSDFRSGPPNSNLLSPNFSLQPIEYKKGKRRQFENDDAQLCAQAMCLEEMFGTIVPAGAVFHAATKRRREIEFTPQLRSLTEQAISDLHAVVQSAFATFHSPLSNIPAAILKPACEECSLFKICLPSITCAENRAARLSRGLFRCD